MTLACWILGVSLMWLAVACMTNPAAQEVWRARAYALSVQVLPSLALFLAALGWQPRLDWPMRPRKKRRTLDWMARFPVTKQERARAQMQVAAVNLGITLAGVALPNVLSFLLSDHAAAAGLLGDAWAHGETSFREIVVICLGPVLVTGLLAWMAMTNIAVVFGLYFAGVCGFHVMIRTLACQARGCPSNPYEMAFFTSAGWYFPLDVMLLMLAVLAAFAARGLISLRAAWVTLAIWLLTACALYPFALLSGPRWFTPWANPGALAIGCLFLAEGLVCGWVANVSRIRGRDAWRIQRENPEQHGRCRGLQSRKSKTAIVFAAAAVAGGWVWLYGPTEPAVTSALRSRGLPASSAELNAWYVQEPTEENQALRYQAAIDADIRQHRAWLKALDAKAENAPTLERKALEDNVWLCGQVQVGRTQPIPKTVWAATEDYWNIVGRPVSELLHETARSGLSKSHWPVNLDMGFAEEFNHLSRLRQMARILAIEAWVAAVEHRPEDAVNALTDIFPIANSLADEPVILSQLVRFIIVGIAIEGMENAVNRLQVSDSLLASMQDTLANALPPPSEGALINRALVGERAVLLDYVGEYPLLLSGIEGPPPDGVLPLAASLLPLLRLVGADAMERIALAASFRKTLDIADESVRGRRVPADLVFHPWKEHTCLALRIPLISEIAPPYDRIVEAELRVRTQLDVTRSALAAERFRLANGRIPDRLEECVPGFLENIPSDPWNEGKPLSYRVKGNGEFVVYSFGKNRTDERGEEMKKWWDSGDITFSVAPPEVREQPQME